MSPKYAEETARFAADHGYELEISVDTKSAGDRLEFRSTRYRLTAEHQALVLEVVAYADGEVRYYLQIERYYRLRSRSFPLDSWKHYETHIEFRYDARPETGLALTFELEYPEPSHVKRPSPS